MLNKIETESENRIFLKYGRIGKHPVPIPIYKVLPYLVIYIYIYSYTTGVLPSCIQFIERAVFASLYILS